jgi:UDP:flavonoid glycosyltransferase YjiC (YdhE family)
MACFLAYTSPARGHLYPITATLLELRDRGHDVHVRTLASEVEALQRLGLHAGATGPPRTGAASSTRRSLSRTRGS